MNQFGDAGHTAVPDEEVDAELRGVHLPTNFFKSLASLKLRNTDLFAT